MNVPTKFSYQINENLYASEYPINKEDVGFSEKLAAMVRFGITDFIDLTEPGELNPYEQFLPDGAQYWRFPIRDNHPPKTAEEMDRIVAKISELIAQGRTVNVHCWGGIGRTGMVICAWLGKSQGLGFNEAFALQQKLWRTNPKSTFTPYNIEPPQIEFLKQYLD